MLSVLYVILGLLGDFSDCATWQTEPIKCVQGNWFLILAAAALIIGGFIILYFFKHIIGNAIVGIIALIIIVYLIGVPIPMTPLVILVSVLGGLGGVGALLIATFFGWL